MDACIKRSLIQDGGTSLSELYKFYDLHPGQEFSEVICDIISVPWWHNCSRVFKVKNVIVRRANFTARQSLLMFKGENGYFEHGRLSLAEIHDFVHLWKIQTDELKSMIFKPEKRFDAEEIDGVMSEMSCGKERKHEIYPYKSM
ncbi:hypothetical protein CAEBREN_23979 [Caenorhabditis brenneri]|uniref:F-box associated domain-containing protein n=1 Tax=Caenorhabditis brenneri TaxID=135651 RepID=G0NNW5_CAEBE|nr:hypothetical protein CAEBREN_23979 [Caenorhabditis brenneri]